MRYVTITSISCQFICGILGVKVCDGVIILSLLGDHDTNQRNNKRFNKHDIQTMWNGCKLMACHMTITYLIGLQTKPLIMFNALDCKEKWYKVIFFLKN